MLAPATRREMNDIQRTKVQSIEKAFPGCLGRMVNLFDLSNGFARNGLLTDKPHYGGSSLERSQSDVATTWMTPFGDQIEDKMIMSELRRSSSSKKANGTPMKTLIAQEMSKEVVPNGNPANVVAKLMGLDTLPQQQPHLGGQKHQSIGLSSRRSLSHSDILMGCWREENYIQDKQIQFEGYPHQAQCQNKDVSEPWQLSQKTTAGNLQMQGRYDQHVNEKKMALVREKFMEAKRLSTIEKGNQSKEFQNALEFLSSNKDALLKFLQESNSKFSQHLNDMKTISSPPKTKRITILRPVKVVEDGVAVPEKKSEKQIKKPGQISKGLGWEKNKTGYSPTLDNQRVDEHSAQSTKIVVLKPTSVKTQDVCNVVSPHTSATKLLHGAFCDEYEVDGARESKEMSKEITCLKGHRRDESLLSSVFPNGYIGDDSSFNKSETEYALGNHSDLEIMSPTSRHSWDNVNRFGSPCSSSFSQASCSSESSVCREAKKRLSERFALMKSNGSPQEPKKGQRSSSTLGEMLALSDMKRSVVETEEDAGKVGQDPRASTSCSTSDPNRESVACSPTSLPRSKSVPASSKAYDSRVNVEVSESKAEKSGVPKELTETKSTKSSLRGKVSSLFFSRNKKPGKEKSDSSLFKDESYSSILKAPDSALSFPQNVAEDASYCANDSSSDACLSPSLCESSLETANQELGVNVFEQKVLSVVKPLEFGSMNENQDQPSPISVLEPPFMEYESTTPESLGNTKMDGRGLEAPFKSNLIDKSPPIGSIARTLSWDDSCEERTTSNALKHASISSAAEEEHDCRTLIQELLSAASFTANTQPELSFTRWHSLESPLDPSLRDQYTNLKDKELLREAKRRHRRSSRKLVFDCVNATLVEMTGYGPPDRNTRADTSCDGAEKKIIEKISSSQSSLSSSSLVDHVWDQMKDWFRSEAKCNYGDGGDNNSQEVEELVKKEVVGRWWIDNVRIEVDNFGKEIERKLLEELVEETLLDLTIIRSC